MNATVIRRLMGCGVVAGCVATAFAQGQAPPATVPGRSGPDPRVGTGKIAGRVLDTDTGALSWGEADEGSRTLLHTLDEAPRTLDERRAMAKIAAQGDYPVRRTEAAAQQAEHVQVAEPRNPTRHSCDRAHVRYAGRSHGGVRIFASREANVSQCAHEDDIHPRTASEDRPLGSPCCEPRSHRGHRSRAPRRGASAI